MLQLRELQIQFANALIGGVTHDEPAMPPSPGMEVYRNNLRVSLTETLARAYPVVRALGGTRFFDAVASRYLQAYLPTDGALRNFGSGFADFLEALGAVRAYPYFPDVARLEWACQEALLAPTAAALDVARLAAVDPARYASLRFSVHPSATVLASAYPVLSIWNAHQGEQEELSSVDPHAEGEKVLVWRPRDGVVMKRLGDAECVLLQAFCRRETLQDALAGAAGEHAETPLIAALQALTSAGVIVDFELMETERC